MAPSHSPTPSSSFPLPQPRQHPNGVQLGGLGTGRVELGCNGRLTLANVCHSPQRMLAGLEGAFFSLRAGHTFCLLQSEGLEGCSGVPLTYTGRHPVARVAYDPPVPGLSVDLTAFSPLCPHRLEDSSLPGAVFTFHLANQGDTPLDLKLAFSWEHLLGCGGWGERGLSLDTNRTGNRVDPHASASAGGLRFTGGNPRQLPDTRGDMALLTPRQPNVEIWMLQSWNVLLDRPGVLAALAGGGLPDRYDGGTLADRLAAHEARRANPPSWDDPDPRFGGGRDGIEGAVHPAGTLGVSFTLAPGQETEIPFVLSLLTHTHHTADGREHGRFCAKNLNSATEVAETLLLRRQELFGASTALHRLLDETDLPPWWSDKLLNDLTPLTTNTLVDRAGTLHTLEASPMMFGALGTLDQRLVSHPGTSLFYPGLNRTELDLFGSLQAEDGSLPHFTGNAHTALGSDTVEYGRTGWPDLCCSFIIQVYRDWSETGEEEFLRAQLPRVWRAADYLAARDRDGDGIPEGGSSWDIEHYSGAFIATATLWLATLRVLESLSETFAPEKTAGFQSAFATASDSVERMWLGGHYAKYRDPRTGEQSDDVFVGQLAGEWVARQLGLHPVLPPDHTRRALDTIRRLNGNRERYKLMPIQVRADGTLHDRKYAWHAWPQYSMVFVDCTDLHLGHHDAPVENLRAFDDVVRNLNLSPWATTLWHDARSGEPDFGSFMGLDWYMNAPAVWWTLPALTGFGFHEPTGELRLNPPLPAPGESRVWPVVTPRFWGKLHLPQSRGEVSVRLEIHRIFRGESVTVRRVRWGESPVALPNPETLRAGQTFNIQPPTPSKDT